MDETFFGNEKGKEVRRGYGHKRKILALVDRDTGRAKSVVVKDLKATTLVPIPLDPQEGSYAALRTPR